MHPREGSPAISPVLGTVLLVGTTITLSALIFLMVSGAPAGLLQDIGEQFQYVEITAVYHEDDEGSHSLNYDSRVLLTHKGTRELENDDLSAVLYRNGELLKCRIDTMNGVNFPKTVHTGISKLSGPGAKGKTWMPGETITLDLNNGTLHPGDELRVEILMGSGKAPLSSDTYRIP